ncbi:MAG: hypothetical protein SYC29_01630 [Planctomycetota bacterium]|nr:hypothetical protein [Planctomycetota bacterium]
MKKSIVMIICAATLVSPFGAASDEPARQLPPNHPTVPSMRNREPGVPPVADPADVRSIDAILEAYYNAISGPPDEARDWDRFLSLFLPDARLATARPAGRRAATVSLSPAQFARFNQSYFEGSGYTETEIHRRSDSFGNIAHVLSTYEARRGAPDSEPYSRGVYSIQLLGNGERWWIASILWDHEREGDNPIPPQYLPHDADGPDG